MSEIVGQTNIFSLGWQLVQEKDNLYSALFYEGIFVLTSPDSRDVESGDCRSLWLEIKQFDCLA